MPLVLYFDMYTTINLLERKNLQQLISVDMWHVTFSQRLQFAFQMISGLVHYHDNLLLHLDVKPANGQKIIDRVDIYSFSLVLREILTRKTVYSLVHPHIFIYNFVVRKVNTISSFVLPKNDLR
ncbi:hypothetical protein LOAG_08107 [Loa loa]|uniref:Protein kinase domain-containing protein n=1 Tax=Loa loa TaxID=7209 RepID=A0A1S0TVX9_LOALO|nr:hypothetical protein LOAG_08107 [Loa loa]EFO20385.1 hypothetical protein LOAG_08107 [Loa loa]